MATRPRLDPSLRDPLELAREKPLKTKRLSLRGAAYGRPANPIRGFPEEILACTNLEVLELSDALAPGGERILPEGLGKLRNLQDLDLSREPWPSLPDSIARLTKLRNLTLDGNAALAALPESLGKLTRLTRLALNDLPGLRHLPKSIGGLRSLETLHMSNCGLVEIPKELWKCTELTSLVVPDHIETLPPGIRALSKLEQLVCHPKALLSIARELPRMKALAFLALSPRPKTARPIRLPEELGRMPGLTTLILGYSRTLLPASLEGHPELRVLDIGGADVRTIAKYLLTFPKLESVDLEDTKVPKEERALIDHFMTFPPHRRIELIRWEAAREVRAEEAKAKAAAEKKTSAKKKASAKTRARS